VQTTRLQGLVTHLLNKWPRDTCTEPSLDGLPLVRLRWHQPLPPSLSPHLGAEPSALSTAKFTGGTRHRGTGVQVFYLTTREISLGSGMKKFLSLQAAAFVLLLVGVLQQHVGAIQVLFVPSRCVDRTISQAP